MSNTSQYTSVLSKEHVKQFIAEKQKFSINTGSAISRAFDFAKANIGATLLTGLIINCIGFIVPWLQGGISMGMYDENVRGKKFELDSQFRGFDFGMPILSYVIYQILFSFVIIIPIIILIFIFVFSMENATAMTEDQIVLLVLPFYAFIFFMAFLIQAVFMFAINLIIFTGMGALEAIKSSMKLVFRNLGTTLIFALVSSLVTLLGVLACFVGVLFTLPMVYYAQYYAFADIFDLESGKNNEDSILQHLVS